MTAAKFQVVDADPDVDGDESAVTLIGDGGSVTLTVASAEHLTRRIREVWGLAWDLIQLAYTGRAWEVLGYRSWNAYVEVRFGDLSVTVPRDDRPVIVDQLRSTGMSTRAIARVLGVSDGTVRNDLDGPSAAQDYAAGRGHRPEVIIGKDGKPYPASRPHTTPRSPEPPVDEPELVPCDLCGESHPVGIAECPWAAFAAGRGPDPTGGHLPPKPREPSPRKRKLEPAPRPAGESSRSDRAGAFGSGGTDHGSAGDAPAGTDTPTTSDDGGSLDSRVTRIGVVQEAMASLPALVGEIEGCLGMLDGMDPQTRQAAAGTLRTAARDVWAVIAEGPALASRLDAAAAALDR